jgi:hypothetical protein
VYMVYIVCIMYKISVHNAYKMSVHNMYSVKGVAGSTYTKAPPGPRGSPRFPIVFC